MSPKPQFTPKPAFLGKLYGWCPDHAAAWRVDGGRPGCAECDAGSKTVPAPPDHPGLAKVRRPKRGSDTEAMLAAQLAAAGYFDTTFTEASPAFLPVTYFRRAVPWGLALNPERGFTADIGFLGARLLCEVKGLAHAAGRSKVRADVEREGLAVSLGWTVLPLTPEQVHSGEAVALIAKALNQSARAEGG